MRQGKKEFIRINLNRKKSLIENLKSLDIATFKEYAAENVYPVLFLASVVVLLFSALVSLYMKKKIDDLNEQIAVARDKKNKVLAEIRALRSKINKIEFEQKLTEYLQRYNKTVVQEFEKAFQASNGLAVQNVSLCAKLNIKECDINKAVRVTLDKPVLQIDLVAFKDIDLSNYEVLRQTYIELGGIPIKRFCLQKKETSTKTAKK